MRRKDREIKEISEVLNIVERAAVLRMGLFDRDYPYIVPLHYGYEYKDGVLIFYAHGAKEGHKIDLIHANPNVCIELETNMEIVSAEDIPCQYGAYYASVIGRGTVELVEDVQEKIRGLNLLMKKQVGREFSITPQMAQTVQVMKITINNFSAKSRKKTQ